MRPPFASRLDPRVTIANNIRRRRQVASYSTRQITCAPASPLCVPHTSGRLVYYRALSRVRRWAGICYLAFCMVMLYVGTSIYFNSCVWKLHLAKRVWRGHGESRTPWQRSLPRQIDWSSPLKNLQQSITRKDIQFPYFRQNVPWSTCCYIGVVARKSIEPQNTAPLTF